jgi:hypothetical protein
MNLAIPCVNCGRVFTVVEQFSGRKIRCQACGQIQRLPTFPTRHTDGDQLLAPDVYPLTPELPAAMSVGTPGTLDSIRNERAATACTSHSTDWRRLVRASIGEASLLESESLGLIALSVADVLLTYALLRRGPAFYESNPVAQWFFLRWNIAGMAVFKFSAMGLVVVIGEIVERHRPRWGRALLLVSCLATAVVVGYGLRLLLGHEDDGAPLQ